MLNVLFLNVGRRVELVEAFRKALQCRGGGVVHGSDIDPTAPALQFVDRHTILPHSSAPDFVARFSAYCERWAIGLVIPTIDPDLEHLDRCRHEIRERCPELRLLLPSSFCIKHARDKRLSRALFSAHSADVPEAVDVNADMTFPVFVKPSNGSASAGCRLVRNAGELAAAQEETEDLMVEHVVGGPEYTVDVLCDFAGEPLIALPRRRLRVRDGEVSQGIIERHPELEATARRLAQGFQATGPVTLQFRRPASNRFVAMEMNARMGGGLPLSIAAGADWAGWVLDLHRGRRPELAVPITDGLRMSRYDRSIFVSQQPSLSYPSSSSLKLDGIAAVVFDLDDTLYLERDFVYSGYRAVAEHVFGAYGIDIELTLRAVFEAGRRGDLFTVALEQHGVTVPEADIQELVRVYREHAPKIRPCVDHVVLDELRRRGFKLALLSDGWHAVQRRKLAALGLADRFDAVVFSDAIGGQETWKPSATPYRHVERALGVSGDRCVYVGDNPAKDFRGARCCGWQTVRIQRPLGLHRRAQPSQPTDAADFQISSLTALFTASLNHEQGQEAVCPDEIAV